jgi:putative MATE family efflux protein
MTDELFANGNVSRSFIKLAIPSVLVLILMISTFLIDGILIGQFVGLEGLAAFNLVYPMFSVLISIAIVIATGGSAIVGKYLGQNKIGKANQVFNLALVLAVIFSIVLSATTLFFADDITRFLGATDLLFELTKEYFSTLAIFFILFIVGLVLQNFIRNEGNFIYPNIATAVSVVINIPLTYVFLGVWGWSLGAAALGTGISMIPSTVLLIAYFLRKQSIMSYGKPIFDFSVIKKILYNGSSDGLSEISAGIVVLTFNLILIQHLGEIGIAAFAIISLTSLVMIMICAGLAMTLQPMVSYNFGANKISRVKDTLKISIKIGIVTGVIFYMFVFMFGEYFIELFSGDDEQLTSLAFDAIRVYGFSYIFLGINYLSSGYLTALQKPKTSLIISMSYNLIFVIIGLMAFSHFFSTPGIWWAVPFANMVTVFISLYFVKRTNKAMFESN